MIPPKKTFTIYLPRVEEVAAPDEPAKVNHEAVRGSETILLVEDSNDLRRMTRAFLQMQGYKVMEATNGADAVEVIPLGVGYSAFREALQLRFPRAKDEGTVGARKASKIRLNSSRTRIRLLPRSTSNRHQVACIIQ